MPPLSVTTSIPSVCANKCTGCTDIAKGADPKLKAFCDSNCSDQCFSDDDCGGGQACIGGTCTDCSDPCNNTGCPEYNDLECICPNYECYSVGCPEYYNDGCDGGGGGGGGGGNDCIDDGDVCDEDGCSYDFDACESLYGGCDFVSTPGARIAPDDDPNMTPAPVVGKPDTAHPMCDVVPLRVTPQKRDSVVASAVNPRQDANPQAFPGVTL